MLNFLMFIVFIQPDSKDENKESDDTNANSKPNTKKNKFIIQASPIYYCGQSLQIERNWLKFVGLEGPTIFVSLLFFFCVFL